MVILSLITVQILFGINYVVSKIIVSNVSPLAWAHTRAIVSAVFFTLLALALRHKHPKPDSKFFKPLILLSLFGVVLNQGAFLVGISYTTATNSAILNTLIPIFTLLIVTIRGQESLSLMRLFGFVLAFCGVLVIRHVEDFDISDKTLIGDLLTILNCLSFAIFLSFSRQFMQTYDRLWSTTWLFIYGSIGFTGLSFNSWMNFHVPPYEPTLYACMIFNVIGGTMIPYFLNNFAIAQVRSSLVALFIYVQPIVTSVLNWVWFGEIISLRASISCGLIFAGVLLSLSERVNLQTATRYGNQ